MQKKADEFYQEYLNNKLNIIFNKQSESGLDYWNNPFKMYRKLVNSSKEFYDGYKKINNGNMFNFIDKNGNLISDIWYDDVHNFSEGNALVVKNGKCNFINNKGVLISNNWFDLVRSFKDNFALVIINNQYNYIDTNGNLISDIWYDLAFSFNEGYAQIKKNGKYNFIDTNGKLISKDWYDEVEDFNNGHALVRKGGLGQNFIDTNGKIVSKEWYDDIQSFNNYGYAIVKKDGKVNMINTKGELISKKWDNNIQFKIINSSFYSENTKFGEHIKCINNYLGDYQVRRLPIGYQCVKDNDKINIKYEPLAIYGTRYVLCMKKKDIIIYERNSNTYENIGIVGKIEFDDNFIFDSKNKKVYLMYEDKMFDVTDYYNMNLNDKSKIKITKGVSIISKNDYFYHTEDEIRELARIEKGIEEKENEHIKLLKAKEIAEKEKQIRSLDQKETLYQIKKLLTKLKELEKTTGSFNKIQVDSLFIDVDEHKEINPLYIELDMLKYIDFSMVSFKNVKISGIDFRECNISLYPQEVYKKDLSGCNFEGLYISPFMDFNDVDLRGTKFSIDTDDKTIDRGSFTFRHSIYDETTTFNNIPFTDIYGECDKNIETSGFKK